MCFACFDSCFDLRPKPCRRCKKPSCGQTCRHWPKKAAVLKDLDDIERMLEKRKKELT